MSGIRIARFGGLVNAFLVDEDDGLTLIDTTCARGAAKAILGHAERQAARSSASRSPTPTRTTSAGSTRWPPSCPVSRSLISTRDAKLLAKDMTPEPGEPEDAKLRGGYPGAKTQPTRAARARRPVGSLEVVAAPGHTPGQVAFLDTRDRTLFAGDAYSTLGGVATTAKANPRFPLPALATWHRPTALATARALAPSTRPASQSATARRSRAPAPRWTRRSPARPSATAVARAQLRLVGEVTLLAAGRPPAAGRRRGGRAARSRRPRRPGR